MCVPLMIQISVEKMNFDYDQQRGAIDKSFVPVKIPFHRESILKLYRSVLIM